MREAWVLVTSSGRRADQAVRLYGPDAAGTLDTSAPLASGAGEYFPGLRRVLGFGEEAYGMAPFGAAAEHAGYGGDPFGAAAFGLEARRVPLSGKRVEYLRGQYAAQTVDQAGHDSGTPVNVGTVLVSSAPADLRSSGLSVSAGRVTMTISQQVE